MLLLKTLAILFTFLVLSKLFVSFKKSRVLSKFDLVFWLLLWIFCLIFIFAPNLSSSVAKLLGMGRGLDSIFLLSIGLNFYLIFILYLKLDKTRQKLTTLTINTSKKIHLLESKE